MWKDSITELDFLGFDYLIYILNKTIQDVNLTPSSIGVYGNWGSGKSSLMQMSMNMLDSPEDGVVCLMFNGWLFEGYEDAKTALIGTILDTIQEKTKMSKKAKKTLSALYQSVDKLKFAQKGMKIGADFLLTGGVGSIASLGVKQLLQDDILKEAGIDIKEIQKKIEEELSNTSIRKDVYQFREKFHDLINETKIKHLIVYVDELDRCSPDTILDILEAIRLLLFVDKTSFIIGADERHIMYAIKNKFLEIEGVQLDLGKEYLEKIIQYPIRIPTLNTKEVEYYITCLLFEKDVDGETYKNLVEFLNKEKSKDLLGFRISKELLEKEFSEEIEKLNESIIISKQLSHVLASSLNGNPRHCKRFLNSLVMREEIARYLQLEIDRKILAKLMILEYFNQTLFKSIINLYIENEFKSVFSEVEDTGNIIDSKLKDWASDKWVENWLRSEPKLSNVDLEPYIFFSRTFLKDRFEATYMKLSPEAQDFQMQLLSDNELTIKHALTKSRNFNKFELEEISNNIFNELILETEIDNLLFNVYLTLGTNHEELVPSIIVNLSKISTKQVNASLIPHLKEFSKSANKEEEVKQIMDRWGKENDYIKRAIERAIQV